MRRWLAGGLAAALVLGLFAFPWKSSPVARASGTTSCPAAGAPLDPGVVALVPDGGSPICYQDAANPDAAPEEPYSTAIQMALDEWETTYSSVYAQATVIVAPGDYGPLEVDAPGLTITSQGDVDDTRIHGPSGGDAVRIRAPGTVFGEPSPGAGFEVHAEANRYAVDASTSTDGNVVVAGNRILAVHHPVRMEASADDAEYQFVYNAVHATEETYYILVSVAAPSATVSHNTITGSAPEPVYDFPTGIFAEGVHLQVQGNLVNYDGIGYGIYLYGTSTGGPPSVVASDNTVGGTAPGESGDTGMWVELYHPDAVATVTDNQVTTDGIDVAVAFLSDGLAGQAILRGNTLRARVDGLDVYGPFSDGVAIEANDFRASDDPDSDSTGIFVTSQPEVTISGNIVAGFSTGAQLQSVASSPMTGATIVENTFAGPGSDVYGYGVQFPGVTGPDVTFSRNVVTEFQTGVAGGTALFTQPGSAENAIFGNGVDLLSGTVGSGIQYSWWGSPAGANVFSTDIAYSPWVTGMSAGADEDDVAEQWPAGSPAAVHVRPFLATTDGTVADTVHASDVPVLADMFGYRLAGETDWKAMPLDPSDGTAVLTIPYPAAGEADVEVAFLAGAPGMPSPLGEPESVHIAWAPPAPPEPPSAGPAESQRGVGSLHQGMENGGGAFASVDGNLTVEIPAGAAPGGSLTIRSLPPGGALPPTGSFVRVGELVYDVDVTDRDGNEVHSFDPPLTLTFRFDTAGLGETPPEDVTVYYWDALLGAWVPIPTKVDAATGTATATLSHLTVFALFGGHGVQPADVLGHWGQDGLLGLLAAGALQADGDGLARPDEAMTRAELARMLAVALRLPAPDAADAAAELSSRFRDAVSVPEAARGYVAAVVRSGYLGGFPDGTLRPAASLSRGELAVVLARVLDDLVGTSSESEPAINAETGGASPAFRDADALPAWARPAIERLAAAGILDGYGDGTFRPARAATRAEAAAALLRLLAYAAATGDWTPPSEPLE